MVGLSLKDKGQFLSRTEPLKRHPKPLSRQVVYPEQPRLFWQIGFAKLAPDQVSCSSVIAACGVVVAGSFSFEVTGVTKMLFLLSVFRCWQRSVQLRREGSAMADGAALSSRGHAGHLPAAE